MLKTCSHCGKIHGKNNCRRKKKYYRDVKRYKKNKQYTEIITSNKWSKTSKYIKSLDNYNCLVCKSLGLASPVYLEVHHIIKIVLDSSKAYDTGNLVTLCIYHHKQADNNNISIDELKRLIHIYRNDETYKGITIL